MLDQPKLDAKLLDNPYLLDMFSRDRHFDKLVELHRGEESALAGGIRRPSRHGCVASTESSLPRTSIGPWITPRTVELPS